MSPMKITLVAMCVAAFAMHFVEAAPSLQEIEKMDSLDDLNDFGHIEEERADRHRRVTCDLLSYGGKINHSACAAHCLARGKAGGRCNNGICQCRKTSFKDLFG